MGIENDNITWLKWKKHPRMLAVGQYKMTLDRMATSKSHIKNWSMKVLGRLLASLYCHTMPKNGHMSHQIYQEGAQKGKEYRCPHTKPLTQKSANIKNIKYGITDCTVLPDRIMLV